MSKTYFTADTHFGHANIIRYADRPWMNPETDLVPNPTDSARLMWASPLIAQQCVEKMDRELVERWNRVVGQDDLVYHLGDFCFGDKVATFLRYFKQLNGRIVLIKGNHDKLAWANRQSFYAYHDSYLEIKIDGQDITLCHYALRVFNKCHYGAWHLYGHSHGSLADDPNALAIDVGVDCHNFKPISFEEVATIMARKKFKPIDHHGE